MSIATLRWAFDCLGPSTFRRFYDDIDIAMAQQNPTAACCSVPRYFGSLQIVMLFELPVSFLC